ncbi:hypothetical protein, conserved [Plasmodium vivax]|uniref:Uncharacterized protein n=1 Tax=Plasmodium vivax (strain Salvador I) TaxID=126793 RepID=A5K341_PLAVS|nr:hypothetical protein, conserved [Plasmodium vivax]EDL45945.1 hypothetical protein, conserved [Plasmodium vivax]|eukprot:XP_001615672.1 hypothetical protein [Plasmodium vivax Sal-1]
MCTPWQNALKDQCNWLDEGELERLTQTVHVQYACQYLVKTNGSFLTKGESIFFLVGRSHFGVASTSRYAKNMAAQNRAAKFQGTQKNPSKVKLKKKDSRRDPLASASNATQEESFPYLILICSVCIKRGGGSSEVALPPGDYKTEYSPNGPNVRSSSNECTPSGDALVGRSEEALSDGLHTFCFSFFSCKGGRRKRRAGGDPVVRKRSEEKRPIFSHVVNPQGGLLNLLTSKLGSVPGVVADGSVIRGGGNSGLHVGLSPRDILNCECFVRKIGEERLTRIEDAKGGDKSDRERNPPLRVLPPNLFLNNSGYDEWGDYPFDEEIRKRDIHLRVGLEHFFLVYVKRRRRGDFSVEWLLGGKNKTKKGETSKGAKKSDNTQNGSNSPHLPSEEKLISCSFMSVEEYLERKLKMKMAFLKKKLTIGGECPVKVLLKYTVTIPQVGNLRAPLFYVIHKVNELKVMPHLDLYICNVTKWRGGKKKKKKKSKRNEENMEEQEKEEEEEDDGEDEDDPRDGVKTPFYKISMENFIHKIGIPPCDKDADEAKDECTYLFLVVPKKVERLIGRDLHFEIAVAAPPGEKDASSEEHTKRKKTNIRVNEVSSFCKSYNFNQEGEHIEMDVKNDSQREHTSGGVDSKNGNSIVAEKKDNQRSVPMDALHLNTCNCPKKTKKFTFIKKIAINGRSDSTWGAIYVDLKNPHLFKNIFVKLLKVKRKKISHEKCANLNFITNNWGREIIRKRRRKKSVFFKHVELSTTDEYALQVEVNMLSHSAQKRVKQDSSPVCLPQRGNDQSETPSEERSYVHPNILVNVLLNFSEEVSLEEDTFNEDVESEMKKFFDFGKINLENITLASQPKHMDNIFSLKNDLLFRYRGNYDEIFRHLSKVCSGDIQGDIPSALPLGENSHPCDGKGKRYTKGTPNWVNPLSDNHYDDLLCTNEAGETPPLEPSISKEQFFQALSSVLKLSKETSTYVESKLLHAGSGRVERSAFAQMLQAVGSETACLSFGAPENGDKQDKQDKFEKQDKLDKFEKYPFAKLVDLPPNAHREEKKRKADDPTSKEFEASFDSLLSLSAAAKKTIDDVKASYNLKNKVDAFKIKMDAELQLRGNTFYSLGGKTASATRTAVRKKRALVDKTKKGAYNPKGNEKETFHVQQRIDPPVENLQDLINAVKRVNPSSQLNGAKGMKMEISKMMKERKAFIENVKNSVKTKRFKNLPPEELKEMHQKGNELKLNIYNPNVMQYIKTHYLLLDRLNDLKALLNPSKLKKSKMTTHEKETLNVEEAVADKKLFMQLFRECSDVIKNENHLQLSDSYKNLCKDAQQIFNKLMEGTQGEKKEAAQ